MRRFVLRWRVTAAGLRPRVTLPPIGRQRLAAALGSRGAAPRKRHGQHFLLDENLLAAIVRDAQVERGDTVLEIGPGPGLLTRHLLSTGASVVAVEIDSVMEAVAAEFIDPSDHARLRWIHADALAGGRALGAELRAELPRVDLMVANLPYGIAGTLLAALVCEEQGPRRQVAMIQKEMGQRLVAGVGTRNYGPLAVIMGLCAHVQVLRKVPPGAFWPPPKVDSVVVRVELRQDRPSVTEMAGVQEFLALAFHNRRKTIWNSIDGATRGRQRDRLESLLGDRPEKSSRAEAIHPVQLCALAKSWTVLGDASGN